MKRNLFIPYNLLESKQIIEILLLLHHLEFVAVFHLALNRSLTLFQILNWIFKNSELWFDRGRFHYARNIYLRARHV